MVCEGVCDGVLFDFVCDGVVVVFFDCVVGVVGCVWVVVDDWYLFCFGDGCVFVVWSCVLFWDYLCWYLGGVVWVGECCVCVWYELCVGDVFCDFVVGVLCDGVVVVYVGDCFVLGYVVCVCD